VLTWFCKRRKSEDEADLVAGVLLRKAGLSLERAQFALDVLAFYGYNQSNPQQYSSILQIQQSFEAQFLPNSRSYSSIARRKQLLAQGYNLYGAPLIAGTHR
jgi:hypothetical protein